MAGTRRRFTRVLSATLAAVLLTSMVVTFSVVTDTPAEASATNLCKGFTGCKNLKYSTHGYDAVYKKSWWTQYSGHNCTNYIGYLMTKANVAKPWSGSMGTASNWGARLGYNATPAVGAIAWWDYGSPRGYVGHVAYVEKVSTDGNTIVVSEDRYGGDFYWVTISRAPGVGWPDGFIHFKDSTITSTGTQLSTLKSAKPFGSFDSVVRDAAGVRVRGWAIDPDTKAQTSVQIAVDGVVKKTVKANVSHSGIDSIWHKGSYHGFDTTLATPRSGATITVTAVNLSSSGATVGSAQNVALRTRIAPTSSTPIGHIDSVKRTSAGVQVVGWALDRDTSTSITVRLAVDGVTKATTIAKLVRTDVGTKFKKGSYHGFSVVVPYVRARESIRLVGSNFGGGPSPAIVTVTGP